MEEEKQKRQSILNFCPNCGKKIEWNIETKFCDNCGVYLIPYIPQNQVAFWLGRDRELSEGEIVQLYNFPYHPTPIFEREFKKEKKLGWKGALGYPLLAYFIKFLILLIPTFIILYINIDKIDLTTFDIPENILSLLTFIDISTQFIFILVPLYILKYYYPKKISLKEKLNLLGIPIGKLNKKGYVKEISIGILFAIITTFLIFFMQYISAYLISFIYKRPVEEFLNNTSDELISILPLNLLTLIIIIIIMFLSVAPSEEVLFRGVSQQGFINSFGTASGIIITAIYFSLFHIYLYLFLDPAYFLFLFFPYFSISIILGLLYIWRKNLIACITTHALYNSIQFIIAFLFI